MFPHQEKATANNIFITTTQAYILALSFFSPRARPLRTRALRIPHAGHAAGKPVALETLKTSWDVSEFTINSPLDFRRARLPLRPQFLPSSSALSLHACSSSGNPSPTLNT